jgi:phosphoglycerol transferase MdoB-like AlkP superfamily enzyme
MFYKPDGSLKSKRDGVVQQIDIMPTILGILEYDLPYIAFGNDLTKTPAENTFAVNSNNGIFQLFKNGHLFQFDGETPIALYEYGTDKMLQENLLHKVDYKEYELFLKSFIQQYMERMVDRNGLSVSSGSDSL